MNYAPLFDLARTTAEMAANLLHEHREMALRAGVQTKSSAVDLVTEADKATERLIAQTILAERPNDTLLGEEGLNHVGTNNLRWAIDPIDGTTNFVYGIPNYCVSIGVEVDGIPIIGVVINPIAEETYEACAGEGSFLNGYQLHVSKQSALSKTLCATGFSYSSQTRRDQALVLCDVLPRVRDIRRSGSAALDMCSVAAGRVDCYFEQGVKAWDVSAGTIIVREAGGIVSGYEHGEVNGAIVAANPTLHNQIAEIVAPAR